MSRETRVTTPRKYAHGEQRQVVCQRGKWQWQLSLDFVQVTRRSLYCDTLCTTLNYAPKYTTGAMSIISLRLPDELEEKLAREAQIANRPRSEVARDAIAYYLDRLERERFLGSMESAAKALASDPDTRNEALQMAKDFLPLDNEALALGEPRADYAPSSKKKARTRKRKPNAAR